jgi:hypothetical protein
MDTQQKLTLDCIIDAVCKRLGMQRHQLTEKKSRRSNWLQTKAKQMITYLAKMYSVTTNRQLYVELGYKLQKSNSFKSIRENCKAVRAQLEYYCDNDYCKELLEIKADLHIS